MASVIFKRNVLDLLAAEDEIAEDPVRMLRAMRFSAKLGFSIDRKILNYTNETADSLEAVFAGTSLR